jgi:hypothetical protein
VGYSVLKYGTPMLTDIEDLEQAKKDALPLVASSNSDYIEIRDSKDETVTIGYFDGKRFHWSKDKRRTEVMKGLAFVSKPPLWKECSKSERKEGI